MAVVGSGIFIRGEEERLQPKASLFLAHRDSSQPAPGKCRSTRLHPQKELERGDSYAQLQGIQQLRAGFGVGIKICRRKLLAYLFVLQGGIDDGENPADAAVRELREETGVTSTEIVAELKRTKIVLDVREKVNNLFTGKEEEINLSGDGTEKPEFGDWSWMTPQQLIELVSFKKPIYEEVFKSFAPYFQLDPCTHSEIYLMLNLDDLTPYWKIALICAEYFWARTTELLNLEGISRGNPKTRTEEKLLTCHMKQLVMSWNGQISNNAQHLESFTSMGIVSPSVLVPEGSIPEALIDGKGCGPSQHAKKMIGHPGKMAQGEEDVSIVGKPTGIDMTTNGPGPQKRVVVVGGGVGGALLAKQLQHHADVILIDPLRSAVEPTFLQRGIVAHTEYLKKGRVVVACAGDVTENDVITTEGRSISYDYLVIATGHRDYVPRDRPSRVQQLHKDHEKIISSKSILVVGGGPTGVELAAEIAVDFPDKKVTLVHGGPRLLQFIGSRASHKTLEWLGSKRVDVLLDQYVDVESWSEGERTYETTGGETIVADCHFLCTGRPLGTSWLEETMLRDALDKESRRLMVDEHLRVIGCNNIFAIGDVTDVPEIKQGYLAQRHAYVVAKNIKTLIKRGEEGKLATYKAGKLMSVVSLGRYEAVAQFPFTTLIGIVPGMIKSRDLFVGKTRKMLGLNPQI
ncbi:hypothetical protein ACLOJK_006023 [Asimina triloba]